MGLLFLVLGLGGGKGKSWRRASEEGSSHPIEVESGIATIITNIWRAGLQEGQEAKASRRRRHTEESQWTLDLRATGWGLKESSRRKARLSRGVCR